MKFTQHPGVVTLELTRRNLEVLLAKLDDPKSGRTLIKWAEDDSSFAYVTAVEDAEHYADREPGPVFMPSTEEWL